jgi:hypothetical protein
VPSLKAKDPTGHKKYAPQNLDYVDSEKKGRSIIIDKYETKTD